MVGWLKFLWLRDNQTVSKMRKEKIITEQIQNKTQEDQLLPAQVSTNKMKEKELKQKAAARFRTYR